MGNHDIHGDNRLYAINSEGGVSMREVGMVNGGFAMYNGINSESGVSMGEVGDARWQKFRCSIPKPNTIENPPPSTIARQEQYSPIHPYPPNHHHHIQKSHSPQPPFNPPNPPRTPSSFSCEQFVEGERMAQSEQLKWNPRYVRIDFRIGSSASLGEEQSVE